MGIMRIEKDENMINWEFVFLVGVPLLLLSLSTYVSLRVLRPKTTQKLRVD